MKSYILVLLAILSLSGFIAAQSKQKVSLQTGETKAVMGSRLNVKFLGVVEDSRCPKNVTCIWAGNAKIRVRIWKKNQKPVDLELNSTLDPQTAEVMGYQVAFAGLSPRSTKDTLDINGTPTVDINETQKKEPKATAVLEFTKLKS